LTVAWCLASAALAAALHALAFPPSPWGAVLAWIALVPLLVALERATVTRALLAGWLFGVMNVVALSSVLWPVPGFGAQHALVPAAYLGAFPALWCAAMAASRPHLGAAWRYDLLAVALWVSIDLLRAHAGFLAFPLGTLAQTQVGNLPLLQSAAVGGEGAVTALVVLGNLAAWRALRRASPTHAACLAAPVLIAALAGGFVLAGERSTGSRRVTVAALHSAFPAFGPRLVDPEERARRVEEQLVAGPHHAEILVTPESSFVDPAAHPGRLPALQALADRRGGSLVIGISQAVKFERAHPLAHAGERRVRSGVWIFSPRRLAPQRYDKVELVPFKERLPLQGRLRWPRWLVPPPVELVPGPGPRVYPLPLRDDGSVRVGVLVCWESLVSSHARRLARDGAALLLQSSNQGWFAGTAAGALHGATARLRAVEVGRAVAVAANAGPVCLDCPLRGGPAFVVDHRGRVLAASESMGELGWVSATVEPRRHLTPYARVGDRGALGAALAALAVVLLSRPRRARDGSDRPSTAPG
jgi:apolipoprotein N-acyltransferase